MSAVSISAAANAAVTSRPIKCVRFYVGKEFFRHIQINDDGRLISIYHLYPTLADWVGKEVPDEVNPRSHEEDCLKTSVARDIETTLREWPKDFLLANRGGTVLVKSLGFDANTGLVELLIEDEDLHGLADGATTDAVAAVVQAIEAKGKPFRALKKEEIPTFLREARIHVEVIVGIDNRERIGRLVRGRNTSRQVKPWSLSDFAGEFDWIRDILDRPHGPFAGEIGYEENAGRDVTVLDVLSLLTLFHSEFDQKGSGRKAPTVAYSSKGRMDARLKDPKLQAGYKALSPIVEDILRLHDHVYAGFEAAYKAAYGSGARLGRKHGVETRKNSNPLVLTLTGAHSNYVIPGGFIFPVLASLRALVEYNEKGQARWKTDPSHFFDRHGADLVAGLIEQVDLLGGNPNAAGKKKPVYTTLHDRARLLLQDDLANGHQA